MKVLKIFWRKWLPVAQAIGNFNAQVILSAFYLIIIFPLGFVFRILTDSLRMGWGGISKRKTNFQKWEHEKQNIEEARKQY